MSDVEQPEVFLDTLLRGTRSFNVRLGSLNHYLLRVRKSAIEECIALARDLEECERNRTPNARIGDGSWETAQRLRLSLEALVK